GQPAVIEVWLGGARLQHNVFQQRTKAIRGGPDLGLGLSRQPNGLGVAAALEIEDAVLGPAVLVVTKERAFWVRRKRRFSSAGQAEEDRSVSSRPHVGRAMHRHDALLGQHV